MLRPPLARHALCVLLGWLAAGCAGSRSHDAQSLMDAGGAARTVESLRAEEAASPDDARLKRNLGIALWKAGDADAGVAKLKEARSLEGADPATLYFLGRAAESAGYLDDAAEAYGAYLTRSTRGEGDVRARLQALTVQKATMEVRAAMQRERSIDLASIPDNTIAVATFDNVAASDTLAPLARGLAAMVTTDLARVRALRVVERERLGILVDEIERGRPSTGEKRTTPAPTGELAAVTTTIGLKQRLARIRRPNGEPYYEGAFDEIRDGAWSRAVTDFQRDQGLTADGIVGPKTRSAAETAFAALPDEIQEEAEAVAARPLLRGTVDPKTAPRYGALLGARRFVQGAFAPAGNDEISIQATILATHDASVAPTGDPLVGDLEDVLKLEKQLVRQILGELGVKLTPEEEREIMRLPTDDLLAFLAYSRGLEFEDQGRLVEAAEAYREASARDGGFVEAKHKAQVTSSTLATREALDQAQLDGAFEDELDLSERLLRTGGWSGVGPGPDLDRTDADDPGPTPTDILDPATDATIVIEGDLPGSIRGGR